MGPQDPGIPHPNYSEPTLVAFLWTHPKPRGNQEYGWSLDVQGGVSTLTCWRYPERGKKPVAVGLGPPFVIAQLPEPPPNIRGQAGFGSAHTPAKGLHLPWAESSADSNWPNPPEAHPSFLPPHPCWLGSLYPPPRLSSL